MSSASPCSSSPRRCTRFGRTMPRRRSGDREASLVVVPLAVGLLDDRVDHRLRPVPDVVDEEAALDTDLRGRKAGSDRRRTSSRPCPRPVGPVLRRSPRPHEPPGGGLDRRRRAPSRSMGPFYGLVPTAGRRTPDSRDRTAGASTPGGRPRSACIRRRPGSTSTRTRSAGRGASARASQRTAWSSARTNQRSGPAVEHVTPAPSDSHRGHLARARSTEQGQRAEGRQPEGGTELTLRAGQKTRDRPGPRPGPPRGREAESGRAAGHRGHDCRAAGPPGPTGPTPPRQRRSAGRAGAGRSRGRPRARPPAAGGGRPRSRRPGAHRAAAPSSWSAVSSTAVTPMSAESSSVARVTPIRRARSRVLSQTAHCTGRRSPHRRQTSASTGPPPPASPSSPRPRSGPGRRPHHSGRSGRAPRTAGRTAAEPVRRD